MLNLVERNRTADFLVRLLVGSRSYCKAEQKLCGPWGALADAKSGGDEPDRGLSSPLAGMVVKLLQGRAEVLRSVGVRLLIPISEGAEAPRPGHSLQLDAELRSLALLL